MEKYEVEDEIVLEIPTITEVEKVEVVVEKLVNLDKIINETTKNVLLEVSDSAIKEVFSLLGLELTHIETTINQYASPKMLQSLLYIAELDCVFEKEAKKKLVHKIVPYLQK